MFKTINDDAKLPARATRFSAGVDVYANEDVTIGAGETTTVGLGIAIDLEKLCKNTYEVSYSYILKSNNEVLKYEFDKLLKSHYISLKPRSSLRAKGLVSHSGVIDLDYKDEIKMIIHNPMKLGFLSNFINSALSICGLQKLYSPQDNGSFYIEKGDKIGQLLLIEHKGYLFGIESEEERTGGFGSSGNW